jgi:uncharacterized protein YlxP (DUF503 family)
VKRRQAAIIVAVLQLEVGCEGAASLKAKRALLLPLIERWRRGYSLSVARVAGLDAHDWERFALVAVDVDRDRLRSVMANAEQAVAAVGLSVRAAQLDLEPWEPLAAGERR